MATRKPREGGLLRISLGDGTDAFARVLPNSQVAVYAYRASHKNPPSPSIFESQVLWKLTVMKSALVSGRWQVIDYRPLEPSLVLPVEYFIKDRLTGRYSIYRSSDGHTRESSFDECKMLEAAAAWEAEHIEDRLRDHFAGRPSAWVEELKATP
jgi:hypothetical protein